MSAPAPGMWAIPTDRCFDLLTTDGRWLCDCRYIAHTEHLLVLDFTVLGSQLCRTQLPLRRVAEVRYARGMEDQLADAGAFVEVAIVHD